LRATQPTPVEQVIDEAYYRYYTPADIVDPDNPDPETNVLGYVHGLKYLFGADAYGRLVAYGASLSPAKTPDELTDEQVAPFANDYYEYDGDKHVKSLSQNLSASLTC
jgi:hypothetical protein